MDVLFAYKLLSVKINFKPESIGSIWYQMVGCLKLNDRSCSRIDTYQLFGD